MKTIKTYEGFFDVFKKSQKPEIIINHFVDDLKTSIEDNYIQKRGNKVTYRINAFITGHRFNVNFVQDLFNVELDKNKKNISCKISISREHNFNTRPQERERIGYEENTLNINPVEKLPNIINQIKSEINKIHEKIKNSTKDESEIIINNIKNKEKIEQEKHENYLKNLVRIKEEKEKYVQKLLKDFDVENVESIALDLKDDFQEVDFETIEDGGKIYYLISVGYHIDAKDPYNLGLESRIACNEFIKRYKSEYGDDYKIEVNFYHNKFYIRFELGEYPKSFGVQSYTPSIVDDDDDSDSDILPFPSANNDDDIDTNDNYDLDDDNTD
jgi:hypothetical protein